MSPFTGGISWGKGFPNLGNVSFPMGKLTVGEDHLVLSTPREDFRIAREDLTGIVIIRNRLFYKGITFKHRNPDLPAHLVFWTFQSQAVMELLDGFLRADGWDGLHDGRVRFSGKSPLHLLVLPFAFLGAGSFCFACVNALVAVVGMLRPGPASFGDYGEPAKTLIVLPLLIASFPVGFLLANGILWLIPPLRRFFEREVAGRPRGDFKSANLEILKVARVVVPLFSAVSLAAAWYGR